MTYPECNWRDCQHYKENIKTRHKTFTKTAVKCLLVLGAVNGTMPFVLSFCGKEPVDAMGIAWITEIVAVILGYLCKSYFETKQEAKQALEDWQAGKDDEDDE